jgi:hypothetical protein
MSAVTGRYLCWDVLVRDEVFTENKIGWESCGDDGFRSQLQTRVD